MTTTAKNKKPSNGGVYQKWNADGTINHYEAIEPVEKMIEPVICNGCGKIYDLAAGKVVHRYTDCTQYTTPCCGKQADDRRWKSMPDFKNFDPAGFVLVDGNQRLKN